MAMTQKSTDFVTGKHFYIIHDYNSFRRLRQNFKFQNTNVVARLLNGSILPVDVPRMKSAEMITAVKEKIDETKMSCHMERPVGKVIKHNYVVIEPVTNA